MVGHQLVAFGDLGRIGLDRRVADLPGGHDARDKVVGQPGDLGWRHRLVVESQARRGARTGGQSKVDVHGLVFRHPARQGAAPQRRGGHLQRHVDCTRNAHARQQAPHRGHHVLVGRDELAGTAGVLGHFAEQAFGRGTAHAQRVDPVPASAGAGQEVLNTPHGAVGDHQHVGLGRTWRLGKAEVEHVFERGAHLGAAQVGICPIDGRVQLLQPLGRRLPRR